MIAFHGKQEIKAQKSVSLVRKYFKRLGYTATSKSNVKSNGYDLVIIKGSKSFAVEIKTAFYSCRSWQVGKTFNTKNDFIAIVMPNNIIHIEDWESHREKCNKNGKRTLTKIVNLYV